MRECALSQNLNLQLWGILADLHKPSVCADGINDLALGSVSLYDSACYVHLDKTVAFESYLLSSELVCYPLFVVYHSIHS